MGNPSTLLRLLALLMLGWLVPVSHQAYAQGTFSEVPAPRGLQALPPGDPLAAAEARAATQLGARLLGCFKSERTVAVPGTTRRAPFEVAFALGIPGSYTQADLDRLLARFTREWKAFEPLGGRWEDYVAHVNELARNAGMLGSVSSIKPALVSLGRLGPNAISVVSLRSYVFDAAGQRVSQTRIEATADVLQGSGLVRLTIMRALTDPTDVDQVQSKIAGWAAAVSQ